MLGFECIMREGSGMASCDNDAGLSCLTITLQCGAMLFPHAARRSLHQLSCNRLEHKHLHLHNHDLFTGASHSST